MEDDIFSDASEPDRERSNNSSDSRDSGQSLGIIGSLLRRHVDPNRLYDFDEERIDELNGKPTGFDWQTLGHNPNNLKALTKQTAYLNTVAIRKMFKYQYVYEDDRVARLKLWGVEDKYYN